ncbi:hypothetical protein ACFE04_002698 [Oxalis oulophora]
MGEEYEALQGQAHIFKSLAGIAHNMIIKCAVDLRLADILHSHDTPITLSQLASSIDSPTPPNIPVLKRIMRMLVHDKIFDAHMPSDGGETLYGPTKVSSFLVRDSEMSMVPFIAVSQPSTITPWCYLGECVKGNGIPFEIAHGSTMYEFASQNSEFNKGFNLAMATETKNIIKSILNKYKDGFDSVGSLVDVGGGMGKALSMIVKEYPHINCINFDLPHVISMAPKCKGVTHVGGDMFKSIPKADVIFMKLILHNWSDEDSVKILKKCKEAIPEKGGKVLIVDAILNPEGANIFDEMKFYYDLLMLTNHGGKERSEHEWKELLKDGGFPRYKIINVNPILSLIEAYPE